jgi:hypothetical protein
MISIILGYDRTIGYRALHEKIHHVVHGIWWVWMGLQCGTTGQEPSTNACFLKPGHLPEFLGWRRQHELRVEGAQAKTVFDEQKTDPWNTEPLNPRAPRFSDSLRVGIEQTPTRAVALQHQGPRNSLSKLLKLKVPNKYCWIQDNDIRNLPSGKLT